MTPSGRREEGGDRLVYRKARWKAAGLGIGGLAFLAMAVTVRLWIPTDAWLLVGVLLVPFGAVSLFHAARDGFSSARLTITRDGVECIGQGRPVRLQWAEVDRIEVNYDSDGFVSSLDIWTGGREPRLSTSGWNRIPPRIKADIDAARERWGE